MIYIELLWSFFQIGLFTIGGGYAALPLIRQQVVELNSWLTMAEFADVITIAEMTPGPIAINAATFVGTRIGGFAGSVAATLGCILPSFIISLILAHVYYKYRNLSLVKGILSGLRPAVVGLIAAAGISIIALAFWNDTIFDFNIGSLNYISIGLFAAVLFVLQKWKINPIYAMVGSGIAGIALYSFILP